MFEDAMPPTTIASAGEKRAATERATLSYDALATIVDACNDAVISASLDGEILIWSAGAERMLGYTAAEVMNSHPRTVGPEVFAADALDLMEQHKITALLITADGSPGAAVEGVIHLHDLVQALAIRREAVEL